MSFPKSHLATTLGPIAAQVQNRTLMPTAGFVFLQENLFYGAQKTPLISRSSLCSGVFPVDIPPQKG